MEATRTPDEIVGENLRSLQAQRRVSTIELARCCGVSRMTVYRWRVGASEIGVSQLVSIATVLGCTTDDLLAGTPRRAVAS
jgi:transcriptional regulator with XRE-family HTH domain